MRKIRVGMLGAGTILDAHAPAYTANSERCEVVAIATRDLDEKSVGRIREKLGGRVKDVRLSRRLTDSPACLVADEQALNPGMLRMMEAMGQEVPKQKRTLELNASHPLLVRLLERFPAARDDEEFAAEAGLLLDLARVAEGAAPRQPQAFTQALAARLAR